MLLMFLVFNYFLGKLFIPRKDSNKQQQPEYGTDMRAIENFINHFSSFTPYASLTGPGETSSPGNLTQNGALTVTGGSINGTLNGNVTNSSLSVTNAGGVFNIEQQVGSTMNIFAPTGTIDIFTGGSTYATSTASIQLNNSGGLTILSTDTQIGTVAGNPFIDVTSAHIDLRGGTNPALVEVLATGRVNITSSSSQPVVITGNSQVNIGTTVVTIDATASAGLQLLSTTNHHLGFYGATAGPQPTITGSRGGNAALTSLLSALNTLGLINDASTP